MFRYIVLFIVLVATVSTQSCKKQLADCVKVGQAHLCPDSQVCFVNKADDTKSFCCAITDIDNGNNNGNNNGGVRTTTARPGSATCSDQLNPATGYSDCPARQYLCNDATYYNLMTEQCPKTCGRCSGSQNSNSGTVSSGSCVDKINPSTRMSDCSQRKNLCNNGVYYDLMTEECPKTCGRCTSTRNTNTNNGGANCVDAQPNCPTWANNGYCTNAFYTDAERRTNCAKSCNLC